jgi:hypothetical protein
MLVELIDRLNESIGSGENIATLRTQLATIREQSEALERRLKRVETQFKQIKAKLKNEDIQEKQYTVEEIGREYLRFIAREGRMGTLEVFAAWLGVRKFVAEYHANKLVTLGLIELVGYNPAGTLYVLTDAGTAYVVENNLM